MMCREDKNRNLCQVGTLCQSQKIMPQATRGSVYLFIFFILIKIDFYTKALFALDLSSLLIERTNNLGISSSSDMP